MAQGFRAILGSLCLFAGLLSASADRTRAEDGPIPLGLVKQALNATSGNWVAFRNYNGRQWVYLTQVLTWKCGLKEVRYAINSSALTERWPLPACNPQNPYALDPEADHIYTYFAPGSVSFVSVQIVFADGTETDIMTYVPCDVPGDQTCAALVQ
ncbi:MAG: hypothetical protein AAGL24_04280 [Pseudomonadota bacterium]